MVPMKRRYIILAIILIISIVYVLYWAFFMREHHEWKENIVLSDGSKLLVHHHSSQLIFHGHPHYIGWGGGDPWNELLFIYKDVTITWEGPYIPIVLDFDNNYPFLVAFDRESDVKAKFRFYRFDKVWMEIEPDNFPKHIAIQNMWLSEDNGYYDDMVINEYIIVEKLDANHYPFRCSLTAKMWQKLSKNVKYSESDHEVDTTLLEQYKLKYIRNRIRVNGRGEFAPCDKL